MNSTARLVRSNLSLNWPRALRSTVISHSKPHHVWAAASLLVALGVLATLFSAPARPLAGSQPVLRLPFPSGKSSILTQTAGSCGTHCGTATLHDVDFDTPNNIDEVVVAAADGTAYITADSGPDSFGNHVKVDHGPVDPNSPGGDHYFTIYGHLKTFLVKNNQRVVQGQAVGMEGCTGNCDGDHVHFGLHRGNPQLNAGTSILAEQIVAKDLSVGGQFTTFTSDSLLKNHEYESNNTYPQDCTAATEWRFNNDSRCWFFGPNGGGTTIGFNEPGAWIIRVGNDPYVISPPLSIDVSSISAIEIQMASLAANTNGEVFFATDTKPSFAPERSKGFAVINDGTYRTYTISFSGNPDWKGRLTQLRIDPVAGGNQETVGLMSVRLVTNGGGTTPFYEGFHDYVDCNNIGGWVRDKNSPGTRVPVVVVDDNNGAIVASGTADQFRQDLFDAGMGDGKYGFSIPIPAALKDGQTHNLRVKVLNSDFSLKLTPRTYNSNTLCGSTPPQALYEGFLDSVDCNNISGWARDKNNPATRLNVSVINDATGAIVASGTANLFRQDLVNAGIGDGKYGYLIPTPASIKDGQTRNLRVIVTGTTFNLKNTPKSFNSSSCSTTTPPLYEGFLDSVDCNNISGWARDKNSPATRLNVSVINDATGAIVASGTANLLRQDLVNAGIGDGKYGYLVPTPAAIKDGQTRNLRVIVTGTTFNLKNTPKSFNSSSCGGTTQPSYEGFHDFVDCNNIAGWVRDKNSPGTRLNVSVFDDNTGALVASGTADQFRQDLVNAGIGDGKYGFFIPTPSILKNGQTHSVRVRVTGTNFNLGSTPRSFTNSCTSGPDLIVTNSSGSSSIVPGGTINVSATVVNQGSGSAGNFRLGFYLSNDGNITTSDTLLGVCTFSGLSAGASTSCSGPLSVPQLSPGSYSLGAFADDQNAVTESNEGNNIRVVSGIVVEGSSITWEFTTAGNFLGWNVVNASASSVNSGVLFIDPAGSDPYIEGPSISASASVYKTVVVRMASNGLDPFGNIFFRTQSENFYSADKRVSFTVQNCSLCGNASFVTYTITMSGNSKWTGTITGLRIDPANDGKAGTNIDSMGFDFIRLTP